MERVAFTMKLLPGCSEAYRQRHDALWPELAGLLKAAGIADYGIYLEAATGVLFAVLKVPDKAALAALPQDPVMQRWWQHMRDLMETNPDGSPVTWPLAEMFYLP